MGTVADCAFEQDEGSDYRAVSAVLEQVTGAVHLASLLAARITVHLGVYCGLSAEDRVHLDYAATVPQTSTASALSYCLIRRVSLRA